MYAAIKDRRILLGLALLTAIAVSFWTGSRIPQLNEKASMGTEVSINTLGFDTVFKIQPGDSLIKQILYTTVNWMDTNKKGMTFGVLFASALMTLFSLFRRRSFRNSFANSALGLVIGTPLGVCVNCAAPIAAGMAAAGTRLETTLATMISSPTLNVIVLTMLFSLFPLYLVLIKIGFTLLFILLLIPLISRYLLKREMQASSQGASYCGITATESCPVPAYDVASTGTGERWWPAGKWLLINYAKNFWFVFRTTVPLMALAGFLGAIIITLLPWGSLADIIPTSTPLLTLLSMCMVALVGVFLPVPIAFDVVVSAILLAAGMPVKYVMVLLFTLGIYSIYSFFIVQQSVSRKAALTLFFTLAGLGVVSGVIAHEYHKWEFAENQKLLLKFFVQSEGRQQPGYRLAETGDAVDRTLAGAMPLAMTSSPIKSAGDDQLVVRRIAFAPYGPSADKPFTRLEGGELGLDVPFEFSLYKTVMPISLGYGRMLSSGDVHNDGWQDVLFVSESGLGLYANAGGRRFVHQAIDLPAFSGRFIASAALVDLNNDGWLDIFFTTLQHGNYLIYNHGGRFSERDLHPVPGYDQAIMTTAMGFGDTDADGDLDIVLGHWAIGWGAGNWLASDRSRNILLENGGDGFSRHVLAGIPGVPVAMLLSDYNGDGKLDLIIGNDFDAPDLFYLGDGKGGFRVLSDADGVIPHSTHDTMSIITADIDNDLRPELYLGDIARYPDSDARYFSLKVPDVCREIVALGDREKCAQYTEVHQTYYRLVQTNNVRQCLSLPGRRYQEECIVFFFIRDPQRHGGDKICKLIPPDWSSISLLCEANLRQAYSPAEEELATAIPQTLNNNVLLAPGPGGRFVDRAEQMGLNLAGWTWNAKFADLDNDEWQDLYVANGWIEAQKRRESNYFFHNREGRGFDNRTDEFGLGSHLATSSYSYVDIDNDGDLDIITLPMNGPVQVFVNNSNSGKRIAFELRDRIGNRFGVGSKLTIHYGPGGKRHQVRELQASGGFLSFDAPILYFGLGDYDKVERIEITWSTGERSELHGDFAAGARYRITRQAPAMAGKTPSDGNGGDDV